MTMIKIYGKGEACKPLKSIIQVDTNDNELMACVGGVNRLWCRYLRIV